LSEVYRGLESLAGMNSN